MHFPEHHMPLLTSDQSPKNHTKNAIHFFVDSVSIWKNRVFPKNHSDDYSYRDCSNPCRNLI